MGWEKFSLCWLFLFLLGAFFGTPNVVQFSPIWYRISKVQEKQEAEAEYEKGLEQQKTSILLTEETPDIFQIKLGHLPPGAGARVRVCKKCFTKSRTSNNPQQVRLTYLSELPVEEGKIRLTIPTTVAPRWQKIWFTNCALLHWKHSTFRNKVFKPRPARYSESTTSRYVPASDSSVEARRISSIEHNFSSSVQVFLSSA